MTREIEINFERFLQDKHADQYQGLDDEMPDNFTEWLCDLDPQGLIDYAEEWHKSMDKSKQMNS